ncbi:MAG: alanine--tRNA ligase, partial [Lachnospiraceae bacterium]|nr:alanine--tRNA ligase [Lachnospiraceae bacterium]
NSFDNKDMNTLKDLVDSIKEKLDNYVVVAFANNSNSVSIVVSLSDAAVGKGLHAGNILKECAKTLGGNGGGKDKFAQGQGKDVSKISDAMALAKKLINE